MTIFLVASVFATFLLGASLASADYAIAGEWFGNRGPTVNIPAGQFDETCPPLTSVNVPFATPTPVTFPDPAIPLPASQWVPGPCGRAQKHAFTATIPGNSSPTLIPANAIAVVAHSGIPARGQQVLGVPTVNPIASGQSFRVPPRIFTRALSSEVPVPANVVVQQLDTTFVFSGPGTLRTPSSMMPTTPTTATTPITSQMQWPGDANSTRRMQKTAWDKPGMGTRPAASFNFQTDELSTSVISRRVTYTAGANNFGGTMGMLLDGGGTVYIVADLLTFLPGSEVALSAVGDTVTGGITVHMGRGYNTTQRRSANPAPIFPTFNVPVKCLPNVIPPTPQDCDFITGIINNIATFPTQGGGTIMFTTMQPFGALPGATTVNIGFPWTTGHVSAYGKGSQGGVAQTTTLTAVGNDSGATPGGVRTIQLVAAGIALRQGATIARTPHLETVTIQVPEPGSTLMLGGALGLLGGLYSVRRRFF